MLGHFSLARARRKARADRSIRPLLPDDIYWDATPSWSHDGKHIAFVSTREDENTNVFVVDVDGSHLRRLTDNLAEDYDPEWSPDGTKIAFVARLVRGGSLLVHVMNADGSNLRTLDGDRSVDQTPSWSSDGQHIIFSSIHGRDFDLFMMDADGKNVRQLTDNPVDDWGPVWRP